VFGRLTNLALAGQLEAILVRMPVGLSPSDAPTYAGEEFLYAMSGEISLTLEGTTFILQNGDAAHDELTVPYPWCSTAGEKAVILWGIPRLFPPQGLKSDRFGKCKDY